MASRSQKKETRRVDLLAILVSLRLSAYRPGMKCRRLKALTQKPSISFQDCPSSTRSQSTLTHPPSVTRHESRGFQSTTALLRQPHAALLRQSSTRLQPCALRARLSSAQPRKPSETRAKAFRRRATPRYSWGRSVDMVGANLQVCRMVLDVFDVCLFLMVFDGLCQLYFGQETGTLGPMDLTLRPCLASPHEVTKWPFPPAGSYECRVEQSSLKEEHAKRNMWDLHGLKSGLVTLAHMVALLLRQVLPAKSFGPRPPADRTQDAIARLLGARPSASTAPGETTL